MVLLEAVWPKVTSIWRHHTFNNSMHLKFGLRSLDVIENATTEYMADAISYYWISGLVICSNVHEICKKSKFSVLL